MSILSSTFHSIVGLFPAWRTTQIGQAAQVPAAAAEVDANWVDLSPEQRNQRTRRPEAYRQLAEHMGLARIEPRSHERHDW